MGWADIAALALVAAWLAATVLWLLRRRKTGKSCSGCCAECGGCSKSRKE